jgi:hypothetical protein
MKKSFTILFALSFPLVLWANGTSHSTQIAQRPAGNIPDGMYSIVGEGNHRCLEIPNASCRSEIGLQTFDCDATDKSNNQKFNIVADGSGYYTISPVHSDLCVEVSGTKDSSDRIPVQQSECSPGKLSQKWAMSQYGVNLEIRSAVNNQCLDIMGRATGNYAPVFMHACSNGTNQRWRLSKKTLSGDGVICRASPSHPEHDCSGLNDKQQRVYLGKTLTRTRCEEACKASNVSGCKWEGSQ